MNVRGNLVPCVMLDGVLAKSPRTNLDRWCYKECRSEEAVRQDASQQHKTGGTANLHLAPQRELELALSVPFPARFSSCNEIWGVLVCTQTMGNAEIHNFTIFIRGLTEQRIQIQLGIAVRSKMRWGTSQDSPTWSLGDGIY